MPYTIAQPVCFEEEIKKSRFQAFAIPVENQDQIKSFLERHKDPSTAHQCWAWKLGQEIRFNDDGEPSGTAGRPILASIEGHELSNVLVLVKRWFGGIKLGTGGLVRAYGGCAGQCILLAEKIELIEKKHILFFCHFNEWPILEYELKLYGMDYQQHYGAQGVRVEAQLPPAQIEAFNLKLQHLTRGREHISLVESVDER